MRTISWKQKPRYGLFFCVKLLLYHKNKKIKGDKCGNRKIDFREIFND